MASLILLLSSLAYIMVLAVINGSGRLSICAMGYLNGAVGVGKRPSEKRLLFLWNDYRTCYRLRCASRTTSLSGQYSNHYIAFRLLAVLRR